MQTVGTVVDGQHILLAVKLESAFADAVAISANQRGEIRLRGVDDILNVVMTLNDVGSDTVFVGNHDGYNSPTVVGNGYLIAILISQNEKICLLSVDGGLKIFAFQTTNVVCLRCVRHIPILFIILSF